ncbi:MAG: putative porin [Bacteroidota bacterium]
MHRYFLFLIHFLFVAGLLNPTAQAFSGNTLKADTLVRDTVITPIEKPPGNDTIPEVVLPVDTAQPVVPTPPPPPARRATAQQAEEPEKPRSFVPWYSEEQLQTPYALTTNHVDTTLHGFHMYDFAANQGYLYAHKGNPGHAHRHLYYSPQMRNGLILNDRQLYGGYLFEHDELKFYRPRYVFTELFYVTGSDREQLFNAKHMQKLHETFHAGLQYRIINSPGSFNRMSTRNANLYLTADYLSKNQRYQALGSFIVNRLRNEESGGLEDPQAFEQDQRSDFVNLDQAETWYRDISFNLRHFYQTGFYITEEEQEDRFINLGRINHDFTYQRTAFLFTNSAAPYPYYDFPKLDSTSTMDSTVVHRVENLVSWSNFPVSSGRGTFPFNFKLYLKHSYYSIQQPAQRPEDAPVEDDEGEKIYYATRNSFNQLVQGIEIESDRRKLLSFEAFANLTLGGYNDDDFHAGGTLHIGREDREYNLELMMRYANMKVPYFYNNISVNQIRWNMNFGKQQLLNLRASLHLPWITLEGNYYLVDNGIYFNQVALPEQNTTELGYFSLGAFSEVQLGRFGLRNHIILQESTSRNFQSYPLVASYHSVFVNFGLSDNALMNHVGIDFHYNTPYQPMNFMPVTRAFYLQNQFDQPGKYLLDVFWSGKIKSARLFVKYQNLLGLVLDLPPHYDIPFYPIPETMFKFGVSWMFFD